MSSQYLPLSSTTVDSDVLGALENEIQPPPTLDRVAQTNRAALHLVAALDPGNSPEDVTSTLVREKAEDLLKKNVADHAMLLRDHKKATEILREAIAKQKQVTASMEATLAILEAIQGA